MQVAHQEPADDDCILVEETSHPPPQPSAAAYAPEKVSERAAPCPGHATPLQPQLDGAQPGLDADADSVCSLPTILQVRLRLALELKAVRGKGAARHRVFVETQFRLGMHVRCQIFSSSRKFQHLRLRFAGLICMLVIRDLAKWLHGARSKMRLNHSKNFDGPNHRSMVPEPDHFARVHG